MVIRLKCVGTHRVQGPCVCWVGLDEGILGSRGRLQTGLPGAMPSVVLGKCRAGPAARAGSRASCGRSGQLVPLPGPVPAAVLGVPWGTSPPSSWNQGSPPATSSDLSLGLPGAAKLLAVLGKPISFAWRVSGSRAPPA